MSPVARPRSRSPTRTITPRRVHQKESLEQDVGGVALSFDAPLLVIPPHLFPAPSASFFHAFLAKDASKRWAEGFFQIYSPMWIAVMAMIVGLELYKHFTARTYILVGVLLGLPCWVAPLMVVGSADAKLPWYKRYWLKHNVFCAALGYVLNHLGTHWFYQVLLMRYDVPTDGVWEINGVPICMFLLTHPYFCTYFAVANPLLRFARNQTSKLSSGSSRKTFLRLLSVSATTVIFLSYITAFLETWTISSFPLYSFADHSSALWVGSIFYGSVFVVSFPLCYVIDEHTTKGEHKWTLWQVLRQALCASMMALLAYEFWRLAFPRTFNPMSTSFAPLAAHPKNTTISVGF